MRGLDILAGNDQVKHHLSAGRGFSHAYILTGPAGCGKRTLAELLARALVCSGGGEVPCGTCPDCRKAASGIHPDIVWVGEEGKDVNVSMVRALRSDAYIRPNEAPRKVYLIPNAHTMNQSAQNALLKLLEEGPPYAAFLLMAENGGAMLPTVRSRCELLSLGPVSESEALSVLSAHFPNRSADQIADAARQCEGVIGRGITLLEDSGGKLQEIQKTAGRLVQLLLEGPEIAALEFCVGLEKWEREDLSLLLEESMERLRADLGGYRDIRHALSLAERLKEIRRGLDFHMGAGHVSGWLCAGSFKSEI